jgi:hypothetical protein
MYRMTVCVVATLSLLAPTGFARAAASYREPGQTPVDGRPVSGEWRSGEQFENQARATLVVDEGAGGRTGTLTLRGLTNGDDDRATLRVPFRGATWDGTTLSFVTVLPDGEGDTRWALRVTAPGRAVLGLVTDDGRPMADGPTWDMTRP